MSIATRVPIHDLGLKSDCRFSKRDSVRFVTEVFIYFRMSLEQRLWTQCMSTTDVVRSVCGSAGICGVRH